MILNKTALKIAYECTSKKDARPQIEQILLTEDSTIIATNGKMLVKIENTRANEIENNLPSAINGCKNIEEYSVLLSNAEIEKILKLMPKKSLYSLFENAKITENKNCSKNIVDVIIFEINNDNNEIEQSVISSNQEKKLEYPSTKNFFLKHEQRQDVRCIKLSYEVLNKLIKIMKYSKSQSVILDISNNPIDSVGYYIESEDLKISGMLLPMRLINK